MCYNLALSECNSWESCNYLRPPAVGSSHHPLGMDEGSSTDMEVQEKDGGLILDGVGLYLYTPNDSLSIHTLECKKKKKRFNTMDQIHELYFALFCMVK